MAKLKAAIIGCGGRGQEHARGFAASNDVEIVAAIDPLPEAAQKIIDKHPGARHYAYHPEMFAAEKPDIVSVCTWTGLHPEQVIDCAKAGVKAIHSEKPMAPTWGEARAMHAACEEAGVQLTFCHQRRFGAPYFKARELAQSGAIGTVHRIEGFCSNMFDWGTHWFDMFNFYNGDVPAEWVMGQIDISTVTPVYGVPVESKGLSWIRYSNGVHGLLLTGDSPGGHCDNRIIGSEGIIEVYVPKGPALRIMRGEGWETPSLQGVVPAGGDTTLSVLDAIECLKTGRQPTLSSRNAIRATELIFATYESSRIGGPVTLPLTIDDSPLIARL